LLGMGATEARPKNVHCFFDLIGFLVLVGHVSSAFSVEAFGLSEALTDKVDVLFWGGDAFRFFLEGVRRRWPPETKTV